MKIEIFGNSFSAPWVACHLAKQGIKVRWYENPRPAIEKIRRQRISYKNFRTILRFLSAHQRNIHFLLQSPEHHGWQSEDSSFAFHNVFDTQYLPRWVDEARVYKELQKIAFELRVDHSQNEWHPPIDWESPTIKLLCCDPRSLQLWPSAIFSRRKIQLHRECAEFLFHHPNQGESIILPFNQTLVLLEPINSEQICLFVSSRRIRERDLLLKEFAKPLSNQNAMLRSLFLAGSQSPRRLYREVSGSSGLHVPGVFRLGPAVGRGLGVLGLDLDREIGQAQGFLEMLDSKDSSTWLENQRLSYKHAEKEEKRFEKHLRQGVLWERMLSQKRWSRRTVAFGTLLPKFFRDILDSPL